MKNKIRSFLTKLAPILGAGAIGVCPICWVGSASLLSFIGLGALIPFWQWLVFLFLGLGLVGFLLDGRAHRNPLPAIMYLIGAYLLYAGRYLYGSGGLGEWPIWGAGALLLLVAIGANKWEFKRLKKCARQDHVSIEKQYGDKTTS